MSSKKQQENQEKMTAAIGTLQGIADSTITPRNIRKVVKDAVVMLHDEKLSLGVKAANAISTLDEVSQDPNMPSFARVTIWSAVSQLEAVRD